MNLKNLFSKKPEQKFNIVISGDDEITQKTIATNVSFEEGQEIVRAWYDTQKKVLDTIDEQGNMGLFYHSKQDETIVYGMDVYLSKYLKDDTCMFSYNYNRPNCAEMVLIK